MFTLNLKCSTCVDIPRKNDHLTPPPPGLPVTQPMKQPVPLQSEILRVPAVPYVLPLVAGQPIKKAHRRWGKMHHRNSCHHKYGSRLTFCRFSKKAFQLVPLLLANNPPCIKVPLGPQVQHQKPHVGIPEAVAEGRLISERGTRIVQVLIFQIRLGGSCKGRTLKIIGLGEGSPVVQDVMIIPDVARNQLQDASESCLVEVASV